MDHLDALYTHDAYAHTCIQRTMLHIIIYSYKNKRNDTNVLQMAGRGLGETAYDVNHATALLPLCKEIVATASQLVDTLLYLRDINVESIICINLR